MGGLMVQGQKPNKPLFSQHYLEHRIQECLEWQENITQEFDKLQNLYLSKKDLLPKLSEAQTEEVFIKPALDILGFSHIPQVTTRGKGRVQRPDYALFNNERDRDSAYPLQENETAFYQRVSAIVEAKYWERPLSQVSANDKRDIYKNENPSFQIASYLTGTGVDWGILTNGKEWRLYYRQASCTATEFYPVDLVELLENKDLEKFKYFWLFFRKEALVKDTQGRNFLERVREGSTTYATRVGNELKALVFDRVFPDLAGAFVTETPTSGGAGGVKLRENVTADRVYEATLSFLYKLLFLLYAEGRNLLPIEGDYREYSLIKLTQEIAQSLEIKRSFSKTSTVMYDKLLNLFKIVARGDARLGVPRYNGGLFHFNFSEEADKIDYRANHFLSQFKISDEVLAPVLDKLARFEGKPIDYSFLGVRQLGSIYESLLEYRIKIDGVGAGSPTNYDSSQIAGKNPPPPISVHLENDKGERKATGSYYTPDYIVKYIVSHTIKPILAQRKARFDELMAQISQGLIKLQDKRLGVPSINGIRKELQRLEREAQSTLLDIKVCDPAMGSGHFLVETVDYLTDELIGILTEYPEHNPVLEMIEQTRQNILDNLKQQGITINPDKLEPTQLLQRVVMKRCIYGVDLNPIAVELAKVSLWLHSFTIGAPLSFLDHHLRCGNSLIGTTAQEAEAKMRKEESGQLNLLTEPFVGLLRAAEIMGGVSVLSDATFAEVEQSERLFRSFDEAAKPYKRLLDIYISQFFGVKQADNFLRVHGTNAITPNPKKMSKEDKAVYEAAQKISEEKRFFHWDLEFPEVFIDLDNASWKEKAGFDVVVGNPPYQKIQGIPSTNPKQADFYKTAFTSATGKYDIYVLFIEKSTKLFHSKGRIGLIIPHKFTQSHFGMGIRKQLIETKLIHSIYSFGINQIFNEVTTYTCLLFLDGRKSNSLLFYEMPELQSIQGKIPTYLQQISLENMTLISLDKLKAEGWFLSKNESEIIFDKLHTKTVKLEYLVEGIFQGVVTGFNDIFILKKIAHSAANNLPLVFSEYLQQDIEIESDIVQDFIMADNVSRFCSLEVNKLLIYPYKTVNDKKSLIPEKELKQRFPKAYQYLNSLKEVLSQRGSERMNYESWYALWNARNPNNFKYTKILTPDISYKGSMSLSDRQDILHSDTCYAIILKPDVGLNPKTVLAILNSQLIWFYLTNISTSLKGGYFRYKTNYLNRIPVIEIKFTTPQDHRQQALDNTIALYQQYQNNGNRDRLLAQVDHHLSQQPEEADVIHDFLAYLAEQMIALNQPKQTEIKSFWQWLERFIGCPIDTLTNKSKIQNYLGDYNKDEPHLSFNELIEVIKKNKKKLKIDPVARKEQETLEKEYQASLDTLLPIKTKLMTCDKLIDSIVYKLYGLTEEEIAIVEGR